MIRTNFGARPSLNITTLSDRDDTSLTGRDSNWRMLVCNWSYVNAYLSTHPFPAYLLYNPKFTANRLLGLQPAFTLFSFSGYSTLKMETRCSSETLVDSQWTTRRYIPEDSLLVRSRL
jgi:hypothetical protein